MDVGQAEIRRRVCNSSLLDIGGLCGHILVQSRHVFHVHRAKGLYRDDGNLVRIDSNAGTCICAIVCTSA